MDLSFNQLYPIKTPGSSQPTVDCRLIDILDLKQPNSQKTKPREQPHHIRMHLYHDLVDDPQLNTHMRKHLNLTHPGT